MTDPATEPEDALLAFLARCDEALASGEPLPGGLPLAEEHTQRRVACLRLLREIFPGKSPTAMHLASALGQPPAQLGRFLIRRELGRGGFGIVFLADDPTLNRPVALKVPRPEALARPDLRQRFLREARITAGLDHPNIVPVYETGEIGAVCYIASTYCPGVNLATWLKQRPGPMDPHAAARLIAAVTDAVQYAHTQGILHRDLKPSNILLVPVPEGSETLDGLAFVPRLTDFGLAKLKAAEEDATSSGVLLGTPPYMAPEQVEGRLERVGAASDVYALGVILFELLTGTMPFGGPSLLATLEHIRHGEPADLRRLNTCVPRDLETICLKCLHKDPERRYSSAAALADDLRRFLHHEPIEARRRGWADRLRTWSRRPERVRDAGVLGTLYGATYVGIMVCLAAAIAAGVSPGDFHDYMRSHFFGHVGMFAIPWVLCGWATCARRHFAIYLGIILLPVNMFIGWLVGTGQSDTCGVFTYTDPGAQLLIFIVFSILMSVLFFAYVLAAIAYRANRDVPGFSARRQRV